MRDSEIFMKQWDTLREEMIESIDVKKTRGGLECSEINKVFQSKVKRWSTHMSVEGRWMSAVQNQQAKKEVLSALSALSIKEVQADSSKGVHAPVIVTAAAAGGAAVGYLMGSNVLAGVAGVVVGGGISFAGMHAKDQQNRKNAMDIQIKAYIEQIDKAGQQIAAIWRQYEEDSN